MAAGMQELMMTLDNGGKVRFTHDDGRRELVLPSGAIVRLDGRTYYGFLRSRSNALVRRESGSLKNHNLVIEWSKDDR